LVSQPWDRVVGWFLRDIFTQSGVVLHSVLHRIEGMAQVSTMKSFRRLPMPIAVMLAAISAIILSLFTGLVAACGAVYVYDKGEGKGDDLAIGISALCAVGTFVFVTTFSGISGLHHNIEWRTPNAALAICLVVVAVITWIMWNINFSAFILAGWAATALCGLLALGIARRFVSHDSCR
jgi:hypothetical protein